MTQPAASELLVGSVLRDTYEITALLGKGGMGAVYLARHRRLIGKNVAVKVLLGGANIPPELYARFRREAEITSQLGHPNIVEMLDFDTMEDGTPFLVMEYLRGESLEQRLERGPLSLQEMTGLTRQIGSALGAAHRVGVVHRDLKPANVFLVPTDSGGVVGERVKLLDFGISKMLDSKTLQTQEAVLMGTPQYMAPEQALGKNSEVDARTDLFALGCIVYEMLSGRSPFAAEGSSIVQVVFRIVHAQPEPLASLSPGLPEHVVAAVEHAMAKTPADRPPDIAAFISELTGVPMMSLANQPMPRMPSRRELSAVSAANTGRFGDEEDLGSTHVPVAAAPSSTARFSLPDDGGLAATHMPGTSGGAPALVPQVGAVVPGPSVPVPERRRMVSRWVVGGAWAVVVGLLVAGAWWMKSSSPAPLVPPTPVASPPVVTAPRVPSTPRATPTEPSAGTTVPPTTTKPSVPSEPSVPAVVQAPPGKTGRSTHASDSPSGQDEQEVIQKSARDLLEEAESALSKEDSEQAIRLSQRSQQEQKSLRSHFVMARAYCLRKDLSNVNAHLPRLKGVMRRQVIAYCRKQGIDL